MVCQKSCQLQFDESIDPYVMIIGRYTPLVEVLTDASATPILWQILELRGEKC